MRNDTIFDPISNINEIDNNHKIHIWIRQRNSKKNVTSIEQLPQEIDHQTVLKKMRHSFHCNGFITGSKTGKCIQLSGDQRENIKKFLLDNSIACEDGIMIHGY
jgi:translation initiation factor 1